MVTFACFLTFALLTGLLIIIDVSSYHYSFLEALRNIFHTDLLTGRIILLITCALGFISAVVIDIRIKKKESKEPKTS